MVRQPEPFVRCNPASFDIGSDRSGHGGWFDEFAVSFITIKSTGWRAAGYVGESEHLPAFRAASRSGGSAPVGKRRSSTYPQVLVKFVAPCDSRGSVAGAPQPQGQLLSKIARGMKSLAWILVPTYKGENLSRLDRRLQLGQRDGDCRRGIARLNGGAMGPRCRAEGPVTNLVGAGIVSECTHFGI
jgi:hypothetical protein